MESTVVDGKDETNSEQAYYSPQVVIGVVKTFEETLFMCLDVSWKYLSAFPRSGVAKDVV